MENRKESRKIGRWLWLPIAILVLSVPIASSALPALPHGFAAGDPIVADEMNANFDHLHQAIEALESRGAYCGPAAATAGRITAPGGLVGYPATSALCESACSSPTAHMCTAEEMIRNAREGVVMPEGWYSAALNGTGVPSDCEGWTRTDVMGYRWFPTAPGPGARFCDVVLPVLCCD